MNAYEFIQSVPLCSRTSAFQCGQFLRFFFVFFVAAIFETKQGRGAGPVLLVLARYTLAPFRRSRRGKVKARDPIQRWDHSFQVCSQLVLYLRNAGVAPPASNLCFTDQTFVSFAPHLFLRIKPLYRVV